MHRKVVFKAIHNPLWKKRGFQIIALIAAIVIAVAAGAYLFFLQAEKCLDLECFQDHMKTCSRATYINEEPEASWKYSITGATNGDCTVDVLLLNAKSGELGISGLVGRDMACNLPKGSVVYPEKNLGSCHGRLKEDLQQIVIDKLHSYIIENLGQIGQELSSF